MADVRSSTASAAPPVFDKPPCISSFAQFEIIDSPSVRHLIGNAAGKSCELDPVPSWVVQKFADECSPFNAALFNASWSSGSFPTSQKTAAISLQFSKRRLSIRTTSAIIGPFLTLRSCQSFWSVRHTNTDMSVLVLV